MAHPATNTVRPLRAEDIASLTAVIDATGLFPGSLLPDMAEPYLNRADPSALWWTFDDGSPSAIAYAAPEPMTDGTWNLLLIAVDPARHDQGIGTRLIAQAEADLRERGCRLLLVETSGLATFERTSAFYAGRAYRAEARISDYYQPGEDKIVFAKRLT